MLPWVILTVCGLVVLIGMVLQVYVTLRQPPKRPAIDTSRTLKIENSPAKLSAIVGLSLLFTVCSIILIVLPGAQTFDKLFSGWLGAIFFGSCTCGGVWRILNSRGPVITISPEGIRDVRAATALIPWSAITNIRGVGMCPTRCVQLVIKPSSEIPLTRSARWDLAFSRSVGVNGFRISSAGLKIDYYTLLHVCREYWRQVQSK
jgi:hypothetical protein